MRTLRTSLQNLAVLPFTIFTSFKVFLSIGIERERDRQTERDRHRETDRQTDCQTAGEANSQHVLSQNGYGKLCYNIFNICWDGVGMVLGWFWDWFGIFGMVRELFWDGFGIGLGYFWICGCNSPLTQNTIYNKQHIYRIFLRLFWDGFRICL